MWFVAILLVVTVGWCLWRTRFPIDSEQFLDVHVWIWPQAAALFVLAVLGAVALMAVLIWLSNGPTAFQGGWHWEAAGFAVCEGAVSSSAPGPTRRTARRARAHAAAAQVMRRGPDVTLALAASRHLLTRPLRRGGHASPCTRWGARGGSTDVGSVGRLGRFVATTDGRTQT